MKKILSLILCFLLLFSLFTFSVSAESVTTFSSNGLVYHAIGVYDLTDWRDITSQISTYADTYLNNSCYCFKIPLSTISIKTLLVNLDYSLSNTHNYNLKLSLNCDVPSDTDGIIVIQYYDIDKNVIGEQTLYSVPFTALKWTNIDINFTPDSSLLSQSVSHSIVFSFVYDGTIANNIRFSQYIEIIDEDDNASWFEKIISAIKQIPTNFINGIRSFFENLSNKITDLKDSISTFFNSLFAKISELSDNISGFFISLGDRIQVFFVNLGNTIIDGLKALFIPSEDYFSNSFDDLMTFFEDKFGLFALPFTLIIRILELFSDIGNGSGELVLFPFEFNGTLLWDVQIINLKELIINFNNVFYSKFGFSLYDVYLAFVDVVIIIGFSRLIKRKYNSMFDTGYFDPPQTIYKGDPEQ